MKNYIKFQTDLMKMIDRNSKKLKRFGWGKIDNDTEESFIFAIDGTFAVIIRYDKFYLSDDILDKSRYWKDFDKMFDETDYECATVIMTDYYKQNVYYRLQNTKTGCWIWSNTLKYFDFPKTVSFKIKDEKSAVLVYENEKLVGLIMPCIHQHV